MSGKYPFNPLLDSGNNIMDDVTYGPMRQDFPTTPNSDPMFNYQPPQQNFGHLQRSQNDGVTTARINDSGYLPVNTIFQSTVSGDPKNSNILPKAVECTIVSLIQSAQYPGYNSMSLLQQPLTQTSYGSTPATLVSQHNQSRNSIPFQQYPTSAMAYSNIRLPHIPVSQNSNSWFANNSTHTAFGLNTGAINTEATNVAAYANTPSPRAPTFQHDQMTPVLSNVNAAENATFDFNTGIMGEVTYSHAAESQVPAFSSNQAMQHQRDRPTAGTSDFNAATPTAPDHKHYHGLSYTPPAENDYEARHNSFQQTGQATIQASPSGHTPSSVAALRAAPTPQCQADDPDLPPGLQHNFPNRNCSVATDTSVTNLPLNHQRFPSTADMPVNHSPLKDQPVPSHAAVQTHNCNPTLTLNSTPIPTAFRMPTPTPDFNPTPTTTTTLNTLLSAVPNFRLLYNSCPTGRAWVSRNAHALLAEIEAYIASNAARANNNGTNPSNNAASATSNTLAVRLAACDQRETPHAEAFVALLARRDTEIQEANRRFMDAVAQLNGSGVHNAAEDELLASVEGWRRELVGMIQGRMEAEGRGAENQVSNAGAGVAEPTNDVRNELADTAGAKRDATAAGLDVQSSAVCLQEGEQPKDDAQVVQEKPKKKRAPRKPRPSRAKKSKVMGD